MGNTFNDSTEVYDEIVVNDKSFKIRSGEQKFTADLILKLLSLTTIYKTILN